MNKNKGSLFGNLDQILQAFSRNADHLQELLESKEVRLRTEDIERARKYLREIKPKMREFESGLKEFSLIAAK